MLLQRAKTRRDTIKEIAKNHEDAINMGMGELEKRIATISSAINNASGLNRAGRFFNMGSYHRAIKQLRILDSLKQLKEKGTIVSVDKIINDLNTTTTDSRPLADVLARMDAGLQYQTHFISTTDSNGKSLGRENTAIKRKEMMKALQSACIRMGFVKKEELENISPEEFKKTWEDIRSKIAATDHYKDTAKTLSNNYEQAQQDIITQKGIIARKAAGNYATSALAATAVTAGIS